MSTVASTLAGKAADTSNPEYGPSDSAQEVSDAILSKDPKRLAAALKEHYAFTTAIAPTPVSSSN